MRQATPALIRSSSDDVNRPFDKCTQMYQLSAGVVEGEDLRRGQPPPRQLRGAPLAHADTVPPAMSFHHEAVRHRRDRQEGAADRLKAEQRAELVAAEPQRSLVADDRDLLRAPRRRAVGDPEVLDVADGPVRALMEGP